LADSCFLTFLISGLISLLLDILKPSPLASKLAELFFFKLFSLIDFIFFLIPALVFFITLAFFIALVFLTTFLDLGIVFFKDFF
jgi:hypothetical protein